MTERAMHIAVVGGFSSGKSALINALVGKSILPMGVEPVTAVPHRLEWAAEPKMTVVYHDNTTEDLQPNRFKALTGNSAAAARVREVRIGLPVALLKHIEIWDTPGFGSNILAHELAARKALADADVALWVTPIDQALNRAERDKLEYLRRTKTPVLLVVNKADLAENASDRDEAVASIASEAGDLVRDVIWVSARTALLEPPSRGSAGMVRLEEKLTDQIVLKRTELKARPVSHPSRSVSSNEVLCPECSRVGSFDDKFCDCGRTLADQHRPCPRCSTDNTVSRARCRNCNLLFEAWARAEAYVARAGEEAKKLLLLDAETSLEMAVECVSDNLDWQRQRAELQKTSANIQDLLTVATRHSSASTAINEWTRAVGLAKNLGAPPQAVQGYFADVGPAWAKRCIKASDAVEALEWWAGLGITAPELYAARRKEHLAAVAKERARQAAEAELKKAQEDERRRRLKKLENEKREQAAKKLALEEQQAAERRRFALEAQKRADDLESAKRGAMLESSFATQLAKDQASPPPQDITKGPRSKRTLWIGAAFGLLATSVLVFLLTRGPVSSLGAATGAQIAIDAPLHDGRLFTRELNFALGGRVSGAATPTVRLKRAGRTTEYPLDDSGRFTIDLGLQRDGEEALELSSGESSLLAFQILQDSTPPQCIGSEPAPNSKLGVGGTVSVRIDFSEDLVTGTLGGQECSVSGAAVGCSVIVPAGEGLFSVPWMATDLAGNVAQGSIAFARRSKPSVRVPDGWEIVDATPGHDGWARKAREPKSGIVFVLVAPGSFQMGSPAGEEGRGSDEQQHPVEITQAYYLAETETTQEQYQRVIGSNPSDFQGPTLPVEGVDWTQSRAFCQKIGCDLPTEAQWEFACRAGTRTPFSFGPTISTDQANYDGNYTYGSGRKGTYRIETVPARTFPANAWGLHEMHGNVWEWCVDGYREDFQALSRRDPVQEPSGNTRVLRGGSWGSFPVFCRAASRYWFAPAFRCDVVGFRVARTL